jgi:2-alkenal reductase
VSGSLKITEKAIAATLIALTLALAEAFAILYTVAVQYNDLRVRYEELRWHVSELGRSRASAVFAAAAPSVVTVKASKGNGSIVQGSGFVYDLDGNIVTNFHVVVNATSITVARLDMAPVEAVLLGGDVYTDVAVVKVEGTHLPPLSMGSSSTLNVGETVYVVGSPYGLSSSLSVGIVNARERLIRLADLGVSLPQGAYATADLIQFDAAVAPGSSGSPLLNGEGEVVGVVFAMKGSGVAFAVSADIAERVVKGIIRDGRYDHPWLGIGYDPEYVEGMKITYVYADSPAERTGLKAGDILHAVDGRQVGSAKDFITYLERYRSPGDVIQLTVERSGLIHTMQLQLGARP